MKISDFPDNPLPPEVLEIMKYPPKKENPEPNMRDLLARQNRKVIPIVGDGNCFFRAIAQLMYGSQEQHGRVRNEIVSYIE